MIFILATNALIDWDDVFFATKKLRHEGILNTKKVLLFSPWPLCSPWMIFVPLIDKYDAFLTRCGEYYLCQKLGEKIISTVNISNRPKSIKKLRNHLPKSGNCA